MSDKPYRIIYHEEEDSLSWRMHTEEYKTPEEAFDEGLSRFALTGFLVIKLCYPKED